MAQTTEQRNDRQKTSRSTLVLMSVTALSLGTTGYLVVTSDLVPSLSGVRNAAVTSTNQGQPQIATAFLALDPFMVTLPRTDPVRQLRLEIQLEIPANAESTLQAVTPRLKDTMTTYLRAIDLTHIDDPDTLLRTRIQLLRRLQVAAGEDLILDVLITQFLIS